MPTPPTHRKPLTPFLAGPRPDAPVPAPATPPAPVGRPLREVAGAPRASLSTRPAAFPVAGATPR